MMNLGPRSADLTGVRSGRLTALEPVKKGKNGSVIWRCRCDCGQEVLVEATKILHQKTKSCGCLRGKKSRDLTGERFGKLTVLHRCNDQDKKNVHWECQCDCGNTVAVSTKDLLDGRIRDCGCMQTFDQNRKARDLTGQRFGKLVALEATTERKDGSVVWICECDCGSRILVPCNLLTSGRVKSCGCLKRDNHQAFEHLNYVDQTCIESIESRKIRKDNTSGHTGVQRYRNKWRANITFQKETHHLGLFDTYDDAVKARIEAEEKYFGTFLTHYYKSLDSIEK